MWTEKLATVSSLSGATLADIHVLVGSDSLLLQKYLSNTLQIYLLTTEL